MVHVYVMSAFSKNHKGSILESGRSLEEGMATHSTILAWRIPQIAEAGRQQSMGSQRVRHDRARTGK